MPRSATLTRTKPGSSSGCGTDRDQGTGAGRGVLDRVADQVGDQLAGQRRVGLHGVVDVHVEHRGQVVSAGREGRDHGRDQRLERDLGRGQQPVALHGVREPVLDHLLHPGAAHPRPLDEGGGRGHPTLVDRVGRHLQPAGEARQRAPQVVGDHAGEAGQLAQSLALRRSRRRTAPASGRRGPAAARRRRRAPGRRPRGPPRSGGRSRRGCRRRGAARRRAAGGRGRAARGVRTSSSPGPAGSACRGGGGRRRCA